jgi:SAM-dependent methyltransferase
MDGYDDTTYGDAFADVYDEWYECVSDVGATVEALVDLAEGGPVIELGVGTGRIAVPLADRGRPLGIVVVGLDSSRAMLDRLAIRDRSGLVRPKLGNMAGPLPDGPFTLAFVAYNTLFNLTTPTLQAACFDAVAAVLAPRGRFVVEAFVPDDTRHPGSDVAVRSMTAGRVVLSISVQDPDHQRAEGQFVELTEAGGVRLRPWSIRYASPDELDRMASDAGFDLERRWASFARAPFDGDADRHVSVYRRR